MTQGTTRVGRRFYEKSNDYLGMTPTDFRAGGANSEINFAVAECSLGPILVATSRKGICAILMGDDPNQLVRDLQDKFPNAELIANDAPFQMLVSQVIGFIEAAINRACPAVRHSWNRIPAAGMAGSSKYRTRHYCHLHRYSESYWCAEIREGGR